MQIVIFNGPPNSGKDFAVNYIEKNYNIQTARFKDALYIESHKRLFKNNEISLEEWIDICNDRVLKESVLPLNRSRENMIGFISREKVFIFNKTPRDELIYESENIIKPQYGITGVAEKLYESLVSRGDNVYFLSDGGFNYEKNFLSEKLGEENVIVVRLLCDGTSYENDSREYIDNPNYIILNKKDKSFEKEIIDLIDKLLVNNNIYL